MTCPLCNKRGAERTDDGGMWCKRCEVAYTAAAVQGRAAQSKVEDDAQTV